MAMDDHRAPGPVAVLSLHSHVDRSFLDDQRLALLSGDLRADGIENDLVVAVFPDGAGATGVEERLLEVLAPYGIVVFERVWDRGVIERLRARLPEKTFVACSDEHELDDPPASYRCEGDLRRVVPALLGHLLGKGDPPLGAWAWRQGRWAQMCPGVQPASRERPWRPNLRPVIVNPEARASFRSFSLTGNPGCPYQADARENPLYQGVTLPAGLGRGCAFCTTGNHYEAEPPPRTAARVLEQIRYVRAQAPELTHLALKDQNPFVYLPELVRECAEAELKGFTLLLETRADWFLRSQKRFEDALAAAREGGIRIAPYLVGIENFSQAELDRFNKGTTAEANVRFLETLSGWRDRYGEALALEHAAFGFVLFTPWTTMGDLHVNHEAIVRTRFDRLRGNVLLSRARLYPDTALYYLAERDGLLAERYERAADDASRRYGYYPARPWRFRHPDVGHFAALATALTERSGGRDQVGLFRRLLDTFDRAADWRTLTEESVGGAAGQAVASAEANGRFLHLVRPLSRGADFAEGWTFGELAAAPGRLRVTLTHDREEPLVVELVPRGSGPRYRSSRHYDIRYESASITAAQRAALDAVCAAIERNDR
jgi:hypothetical protein